MKNQLNIVNFYNDKEIFVTGGLGFMGKVLIEKLLRSCPGIKKIYILIRESRGKSANDRLQESLQCQLFDLIRSKCPQVLLKLIPIVGDVTLDCLGISPSDMLQIENVSIIFHSAATTRFKEPLSKSIMINTNGAYQVMQFAEKLKYLTVVLHLSTAFCNLDQKILHEQIYPPYADWKLMIDLAKNSRDDILDEFYEKYAKINHNTYTLSKHLAEQVVANYKDKLPVVLFRPSVVINTICDPIPGWTDILSGPLALAAGVGTGIIRMTYVNNQAEPEMIPVDVAIKVIIAAACKKGMETESSMKPTTVIETKQLTVYNCSKKFKSAYMSKVAADVIRNNPFEKCIWNPSTSSTNCRIYFLINFFLFQILPALIVDGILLIFQQKPFLLKLQKKVYNGTMAYYPFHSEYYEFSCEKTINLDSEIQQSEFDDFAFLHYSDADIRKSVIDSIKGLKLYYLKDPAESTRQAKIIAILLLILDKSIKIIFLGIFIKWLLEIDVIQKMYSCCVIKSNPV